MRDARIPFVLGSHQNEAFSLKIIVAWIPFNDLLYYLFTQHLTKTVIIYSYMTAKKEQNQEPIIN